MHGYSYSHYDSNVIHTVTTNIAQATLLPANDLPIDPLTREFQGLRVAYS